MWWLVSSLGLAFAPKVKFVMKRKDQMAVKSKGTVAASRTKPDGEDKTESDAESSNDSMASSADEQESGNETERKKMTSVADFKGSASKLDEDDDYDDDDELLIKKTCKTEKRLQLQEADKAVAKPAKSEVLLAYNSAIFLSPMYITHNSKCVLVSM